MSYNKWDEKFSKISKFMADLFSKDPSTKVGCVIVNNDKRVLSMGYNGNPQGIDDENEILNERPVKYGIVVHAELNAILSAGTLGIPLKNCNLYVTMHPCSGCAKAIIQAGIRKIYCPLGSYADPRWGKEFKIAQFLFQSSGVEMFLEDGTPITYPKLTPEDLKENT